MAGAEPKLGIHIAKDRCSVTLSLLPAGSGTSAGVAIFTLEQLTSVIQGLGLARQHMAFGQPSPPLDGQQVHWVFGTSWYVRPELGFGGSALLLDHPCFGPVACVVPPEQAEEMGRALILQSQMAARASKAAN